MKYDCESKIPDIYKDYLFELKFQVWSKLMHFIYNPNCKAK